MFAGIREQNWPWSIRCKWTTTLLFNKRLKFKHDRNGGNLQSTSSNKKWNLLLKMLTMHLLILTLVLKWQLIVFHWYFGLSTKQFLLPPWWIKLSWKSSKDKATTSQEGQAQLIRLLYRPPSASLLSLPVNESKIEGKLNSQPSMRIWEYEDDRSIDTNQSDRFLHCAALIPPHKRALYSIGRKMGKMDLHWHAPSWIPIIKSQNSSGFNNYISIIEKLEFIRFQQLYEANWKCIVFQNYLKRWISQMLPLEWWN